MEGFICFVLGVAVGLLVKPSNQSEGIRGDGTINPNPPDNPPEERPWK